MIIHFRTKGIKGRYQPGAFTTDSIREYIRDPFDAGFVPEYPTAPLDMSDDDNPSKTKDEKPREPKVREQRTPVRLVKGQHEALIPAALWQSNQQERKNRSHTPRSAGNNRREYPLTGAGRCWDCLAERGENSNLRGTTGSGKGTRYYLCAAMQSRYKGKARPTEAAVDTLQTLDLPPAQPVSNPVCRHKATRRADLLESQTAKLVGRLRVPDDWHEMIQAYFLSDDGVIEFDRQGYNLQQELERCKRLYQLQLMTEADFIQRAEAITHRLQATRPSARPEAQLIVPQIRDFAGLWSQLTAGEQRGLLSVMFAGLYFDAENRLRRVVTHAPFTRLLDLDTITDFE